MTQRAKSETAEQPSTSEDALRRSLSREESNGALPESVTLGAGSRSRIIETEPQQTSLRGLLPVPPEVEAEVQRQGTKHLMTPGYLYALRSRLTLAYYFSGVEVAFRRTPEGIEVLAAGLEEIGTFRSTSTPEERQGVVYGVG